MPPVFDPLEVLGSPIAASPPKGRNESFDKVDGVEPIGEKVVLVQQPLFRNSWPAIFLAALALATGGLLLWLAPLAGGLASLAGLAILGVTYLQVVSTELTVTTVKTSLRRGVLVQVTREVRHADVRLLEMQQGLVQALLGVGAVRVGSAGMGSVEISCDGFRDPHAVKQLIDRQRSH